MPDHRRLRRGAALAAGAATLLLVAAPAAVAQQQEDPPPPRWVGSTLDRPEEDVTELEDDQVAIAGTFRFQKPASNSEIVRVAIDVVDDPSDDFEPDADCRLPEPLEVGSDGTTAAEPVDELAFDVPDVPVVCNGRWLLEARAETNVDGESYVLGAVVVAELLPPPVAEFTATADDAQRVTVGWEAPEGLSPDVRGFLVERAGPQAGDGSWGSFDDLEVVPVDGGGTHVDQVAQPGTYRYRVRTVRDGIDGPVLSSILGIEATTITVQQATTTTTAAPREAQQPRVGARIPRPRRSAPRLTTPTTLDTGFEETLDYGEAPPRSSTTDLPELADEPVAGQAIVRDEDDGDGPADLIVPAAGALVLLGWAGHIVYLNRLAREL